MTWAEGAWRKYLVDKGAMNINPHGKVLELDLTRADGTTVSVALNHDTAALIGKAALMIEAGVKRD